MAAKTPEQKGAVFLSGGMMAVIICIVILAIALIALGMTQPARQETAHGTTLVTQQPTVSVVKSARPTVDLYVMSFCPYGTQAETAMAPVVSLLGSQADFRIRYITTVSGSTPDSVQSLHGSAEAEEDLRQICISTYYPGQFWSYLDAFNTRCFPSWQNATVLSSCQEDTATALSMNTTTIESCATGSEGIALLKADEAEAEKNQIRASPTVLINGVPYSGYRTPEAYKEAVCNAFETAPPECSTVLSSSSGSAAGNC